MDKLTKHTKILNDLRRARERLQEAVDLEPTEINQDATIQRFEFNFELCWKLMKALVEFKGKSCSSPRDCIRIAANIEITDNPQEWISFLNDRNALSHQYTEVIARQIYKRIVKSFPALVDQLIASTEKILAQ